MREQFPYTRVDTPGDAVALVPHGKTGVVRTMSEKEITAHVCGTKLCHDGQPHDDNAQMVIRDERGRAVGCSVACSRCGVAARARWRAIY